MKNRNALLKIAQDVEATARALRSYMAENVHQKEVAEVQTITYAGVMLSLASSVLCGLYEDTKPDFSMVAVNGVLREWGADELV